jgi:uncharacterized DUF497 family protein
VKITYDPGKNERNMRERGLSFERAREFDFDSATEWVEHRKGETRRVAAGYLGGRLHMLCFLEIEEGIRVISFRKANDREAKKYGKPKTIDRR